MQPSLRDIIWKRPPLNAVTSNQTIVIEMELNILILTFIISSDEQRKKMIQIEDTVFLQYGHFSRLLSHSRAGAEK